MEIMALITARGGSKGIPQKNIIPLAGKPLIAYSIEVALDYHRINRVITSTDDSEIAEIAQKWGAEVPFFRPEQLAQDTTPHILAAEHALCWLEDNDNYIPDYLLLLQPTSPFRAKEDIEKVIEIAENRSPNAVVSVCEMDPHPYSAREILPDGTIKNYIETNMEYMRRQDLSQLYYPNGALYLNKRESILEDRAFIPADTIAYIMPPERSLDIDTPWDLYLAELIMRDRINQNANYQDSQE